MNMTRTTNRTLFSLVACAAALIAAPAIAAGPMPTGKELFKGHIKAVGGEKALKTYSHRTISAKFSMPAGGINDVAMTVKQKAPNVVQMAIVIPGMGEVQQGYNGTIGWSVNPMAGPSLLEGDLLEEMKQQADFYSELNFEKHYPKLGDVKEVEFNGKAAYQLATVTSTGKDSNVYFEKSTGLVIGTEGLSETEMGPTMARNIISDYKEVDGILYPHVNKTIMADMGMEQTIKMVSISHEPIDRKVFEVPAAIKALLDDSSK